MVNIEIRISGSGGQGIITAGIILAEAALLDGNNAIQSQVYGPEARGGASKAEVIISSSEIYYPKVTAPQILIALTPEAYRSHGNAVISGGVLLVDSSIALGEHPERKVYSLPILETARSQLRPVVANVIALGAIAKLTGCVTLESLEKAVLARIRAEHIDLNKKALTAGIALAEAK